MQQMKRFLTSTLPMPYNRHIPTYDLTKSTGNEQVSFRVNNKTNIKRIRIGWKLE